jgi:origin recognition complex subunit 1
MAAVAQNKSVGDFLLVPYSSLDVDDEVGPGALTPHKRGRPAQKKEVERAARILGFGSAAQELAEAGIVGVETKHGDRVGRVRLGVGEEDIRGALREDDECRGLGFG